jgi:enoyl-CoA hydratase/carnithine racemase
MAEVEFRVESEIGLLTLNRPEKLNAITYDMIDVIEEYVHRAGEDPNVRALVITGTGRAFSAGTDLGRLEGDRTARTRNRPQGGDEAAAAQPAPWLFSSIAKPTIAAVNGVAVGIGVEIPLQCDFRLGGESARFGWVFVHRGTHPRHGCRDLAPAARGRDPERRLPGILGEDDRCPACEGNRIPA